MVLYEYRRFRVTAKPDAEAGNVSPVHTGGGLGPALLRAWFQLWKMKLLWSQCLNPGIKAWLPVNRRLWGQSHWQHPGARSFEARPRVGV